MNFGNWLQEHLKTRGWSQGHFSRRTGIAQSQISSIVKGNRRATPEHCIAIASALGLSREEVFRERGWLLNANESQLRLKLSDDVVQLAKQMDELSAPKRNSVLKVTAYLIDTLNSED